MIAEGATDEEVSIYRQPDYDDFEQHEAGVPAAELSREHNVGTKLIYQWRSKSGGMEASILKRLKELQTRLPSLHGRISPAKLQLYAAYSYKRSRVASGRKTSPGQVPENDQAQ